jgi:hypothetical protein
MGESHDEPRISAQDGEPADLPGRAAHWAQRGSGAAVSLPGAVRRVLEARQPNLARDLQLVANAERRSTVLPSSARLRQFHGEASAVNADYLAARRAGAPVAAAPLPAGAKPGADPRLVVSGHPMWARTQADLIVAGKMRTAQRRLRAFYLSARPMTVVVHERVVPGRPGRLVGGARMLDRLQGRGELVIPRLLEVGTAMRAEWVVEELLTGAHPRGAERAVVAGDIARLLLATYEQVGVWHRPLRSFPTRGLAGAAAQLAATLPARAGDLDPQRLYEKVEHLLGLDGDVLVSVCHGDPVFGNILRVPDGRLALLDGEFAAELPIAQDLAKVISGPGVPAALIDQLEAAVQRLGGSATLTWRHQLAFALLRLVSGWKDQQHRARRSGRSQSCDGTLRRRLDITVALLADL